MEMKKNSSILVNKNTITAIAIGGFDGMHLAHQELFKNLGKNGAVLVVESGYSTLTPKTHRQEHTKYPIYYYELSSIKSLTGEEFIKLLKEEFPKLEKIVVGFDFCFGKNRKHCISELKSLFKGNVTIIKEVKINNIAVHSRIIRDYLKNGDITTANKLLNKEYKVYGTQIKGQGLGSKSFVPTINIKVENFLLPNEGVYISRTIINKIEYNSVTFLGHRVTTDGTYAVETHILNEEIKNNYNFVEIKFYEKLRNNKKFNSFDELRTQILKDIKISKTFFKNLKLYS
jgi:riboflavin kinase/FMN adenylyltransferase